MKPYSHLIAAVDFTHSSRVALREAVRLAAAFGAEIGRAHV